MEEVVREICKAFASTYRHDEEQHGYISEPTQHASSDMAKIKGKAWH